MEQPRPIRVAVVGGGAAALTAAAELSHPALDGKYQVTVYQLGHRLGGKGASGRGPAHRVEEHGIHLWMGFYENAFRLLREVYAELDRDPERCPIATWQDAFEPVDYLGTMELDAEGRFQPWVAHFPPAPGLPGDGGSPENVAVGNYMVRTLSLVRALLESTRPDDGDNHDDSSGAGPGGPLQSPMHTASPADVLASMKRFLKYGEFAGLAALLEALNLMQLALSNWPLYPANVALRFHEFLTAAVREQLEARIEYDDDLRRVWEVVDMALAVVRGSIRFGLLTDPRGFDAINDYDCREWLLLNGASKRSVDGGFIRALYDLAMGYEDGDVDKPRIAAGQALRGAVRAFFTYRGAFFWRMAAGMGDIIFAPLYQALSRRGVRFEFFHRLTRVRLGDDTASEGDAPGELPRPHVAALEFDVQAKTIEGAPYEPLIDVHGLPCWPTQPRWEQLQDGSTLQQAGVDFESHWQSRHVDTRVLHVGEDFDFVVLGVSVGAIPHVCQEILTRDARWREMVARVKTVATQAVQLWLREDVEQLGRHGEQASLSGYVEPFDTYADMRQLIGVSDMPDHTRAIVYLNGVLRDPPGVVDREDASYPRGQRQAVFDNVVRFLERDVGALLPNALRPGGGFRWELLVSPQGDSPAADEADASRLLTQYFRADVNPSDRYVLALPGSIQYRISPLDDSYDNLTVCGDWTACGFTQGCVEAAVMSGRLAAHALSQSPPLEEIIGYDHP